MEHGDANSTVDYDPHSLASVEMSAYQKCAAERFNEKLLALRWPASPTV
jgi:hypothetical protein